MTQLEEIIYMLEACLSYGDHRYVKMRRRRSSPIVEYGGELSHSGVWGSISHDFIKQAQSRKAFHFVAVKIIIIELK